MVEELEWFKGTKAELKEYSKGVTTFSYEDNMKKVRVNPVSLMQSP